MSINVISDFSNQDKVYSNDYSTSTQKSITDLNIGALLPSGSEKNNSSEEDAGQQLANPRKQLESEINKVNNQLHFRSTRCEFKYFDDINRVAIKVIDKKTDEIVREIPPEDTIKLIQKLWEFAGILYDEKG